MPHMMLVLVDHLRGKTMEAYAKEIIICDDDGELVGTLTHDCDDMYTFTVCKTCRTDWDFDILAWWEKVKWEIEDIIAHRQAQKIFQGREKPF